MIQGDITKVAADAIVHPTSNSFYMGGEVGRAIEKAGGAKFAAEVANLSAKYGNLDTAEGKILIAQSTEIGLACRTYA